MNSEEEELLRALSRDVADTTAEVIEGYPALYQRAQSLLAMDPGPTQETALMEMRSVASDYAQRLTVLSRLIEETAEGYASNEIEARYNPQPIRYLVQGLAECCVLLSGVIDVQQVPRLPIMDPLVASGMGGRPQVAAWIESNRTRSEPPPQPEIEPQPASDPSYANPGFDPSHSPYPPTDPNDYSPPPATAFDPAPALEPEPLRPDWSSIEPPQNLPDDRRR